MTGKIAIINGIECIGKDKNGFNIPASWAGIKEGNKSLSNDDKAGKAHKILEFISVAWPDLTIKDQAKLCSKLYTIARRRANGH